VFFGLSDHVVEGDIGDCILPIAILEHIDEPHPTMGSNLTKRHLSRFEKLDDEWSAYVQEVCSFGRGDLGLVVPPEANLVSTCHVGGPYT